MKMRKITSLVLLLDGALIALSSIILYIVPHGRVAYWSDWKLWGLTKTQWGNLHINVGYLFLIFSIIHIVYNWKAILNYLKNKLKKIRIFNLDFTIALMVVIITVIGTQFMLPPFSSIISLSDYIKENGTKTHGEPPYGHAELSSLKVFAKNVEIDLSIAKKRLQNAGIIFKNDKENLKTIAENNKSTPKKIFMIMKPQAKKSLKKMPLPKGAKSGVGRLVLKDFAEKYSLDLKRIMNVLKINKLKAQPHMTIKEVAQKNNVSPPDVYEIIKEGLKKK